MKGKTAKLKIHQSCLRQGNRKAEEEDGDGEEQNIERTGGSRRTGEHIQ